MIEPGVCVFSGFVELVATEKRHIIDENKVKEIDFEPNAIGLNHGLR